MKDFLFQTARLASLVLLVFGVFALTSCGDDDEPEPTPVEDGFYIQGDATAYGADFDIDATLQKTKNEVGQAERADLLEAFVALKATGGFNIVQVAGEARTTWGPGGDFATVTEGTTDEPKVDFQRGSLIETSTTFTVPADGLYHVVIDLEFGAVAVIPVEYWGIIGGATPNGWSDDTQMPSTGFDQNSMTFTTSDIAMTLGDFKFRYSGGWKVEIDTSDASQDNWVKVNTNFGGSVDALEPGGDNITNSESGFYTATMVWTAGEGFAATLERTGDLPTMDWTDIELGLVGAGLSQDGVPHNWDETLYLQKPAVDGTNFTYTYNNVEVNTGGGGFKIREGQNWDGTILGYNEVVMAGDGAAEFETNGDGNFVPLVEGGKYNMVLLIDASTEVYTFTVTKL